MADLTRAKMIDRVLKHLGRLGQGQSASGEDSILVGEAVDAAHEQLRYYGCAPFETSAIPEWAQDSFRDFVAKKLAGYYGISGERLQHISYAAAEGFRELRTQTANRRQRVVRPVFY